MAEATRLATVPVRVPIFTRIGDGDLIALGEMDLRVPVQVTPTDDPTQGTVEVDQGKLRTSIQEAFGNVSFFEDDDANGGDE